MLLVGKTVHTPFSDDGRRTDGHSAGGDDHRTYIELALENDERVIVIGEICVVAHGVGNFIDVIVYAGFDGLGKDVVELY